MADMDLDQVDRAILGQLQRDGRITNADLAAAVTPRTRLLILNSPNNPSGQVYPRAEVEALVTFCLEHDLWILSDEIYNRLVFDGLECVSPASLSPEAAAATMTAVCPNCRTSGSCVSASGAIQNR